MYMYGKCISKIALKWKSLCSASSLWVKVSASWSLGPKWILLCTGGKRILGGFWKERWAKQRLPKWERRFQAGPHLPRLPNLLPEISQTPVKMNTWMHACYDLSFEWQLWGTIQPFGAGTRKEEDLEGNLEDMWGRGLSIPRSGMIRTPVNHCN